MLVWWWFSWSPSMVRLVDQHSRILNMLVLLVQVGINLLNKKVIPFIPSKQKTLTLLWRYKVAAGGQVWLLSTRILNFSDIQSIWKVFRPFHVFTFCYVEALC